MLLRPDWLRDRYKNPPDISEETKKELYIVRRLPELIRSFVIVKNMRGERPSVPEMEEAWPKLLAIAIHSEWRW